MPNKKGHALRTSGGIKGAKMVERIKNKHPQQ